jgi:hypothetical protein
MRGRMGIKDEGGRMKDEKGLPEGRILLVASPVFLIVLASSFIPHPTFFILSPSSFRS